MNEEARGKALVSVEEIIYSHAVGTDSDNSAVRQWSGLQEHRKRLAELRATLRQEAARDIRINLRRDIRRESNAKLRMVKGEQLNRLLAGYFFIGRKKRWKCNFRMVPKSTATFGSPSASGTV